MRHGGRVLYQGLDTPQGDGQVDDSDILENAKHSSCSLGYSFMFLYTQKFKAFVPHIDGCIGKKTRRGAKISHWLMYTYSIKLGFRL